MLLKVDFSAFISDSRSLCIISVCEKSNRTVHDIIVYLLIQIGINFNEVFHEDLTLKAVGNNIDTGACSQHCCCQGNDGKKKLGLFEGDYYILPNQESSVLQNSALLRFAFFYEHPVFFNVQVARSCESQTDLGYVFPEVKSVPPSPNFFSCVVPASTIFKAEVNVDMPCSTPCIQKSHALVNEISNITEIGDTEFENVNTNKLLNNDKDGVTVSSFDSKRKSRKRLRRHKKRKVENYTKCIPVTKSNFTLTKSITSLKKHIIFSNSDEGSSDDMSVGNETQLPDDGSAIVNTNTLKFDSSNSNNFSFNMQRNNECIKTVKNCFKSNDNILNLKPKLNSSDHTCSVLIQQRCKEGITGFARRKPPSSKTFPESDEILLQSFYSVLGMMNNKIPVIYSRSFKAASRKIQSVIRSDVSVCDSSSLDDRIDKALYVSPTVDLKSLKEGISINSDSDAGCVNVESFANNNISEIKTFESSNAEVVNIETMTNQSSIDYKQISKCDDSGMLKFPIMHSPPKVGDIIAFKTVIMGENLCPSYSQYYQAEVLEMDGLKLELKIINSSKPLDQSCSGTVYDWRDLYQPRLVYP